MHEQARVDDLVGRWEAALDQGTLLTAEELCSTHPELLPEVRRRIEGLRTVAGQVLSGEARHSSEMSGTADHMGRLRDSTVADGKPVAGDRASAAWAELSPGFLSQSDSSGSLGKIGPYEVLALIGRGGMGVVLLATDAMLNRCVAVKVIAPHLANDADARRRFLREAQAAAAVAHPHVVTIHAIGEDQVPYLVMEYVDGISLEQKIRQQGALKLREIVRIGAQIAAGLAAAHKQGLIHRDVKPSNILLENVDERVKITDFGLARAANDETITVTGEFVGTPRFMSPEQGHGAAIDHRSDLFSLGSLLYTMCTGIAPFQGASFIQVIRRVCEEKHQPVRELRPEIPDWLVAIIERLLEKQPERRFQSAGEVAGLLERHLARLLAEGDEPGPEGSLPADTGSVAVPAARRQRQGLIATGVVAGVVMIAAGYYLWSTPRPLTESTTPIGLDPERTAAIWVLQSGGTVVLSDGDTVASESHLPPSPFRLIEVRFPETNQGITDEGVRHLSGLTALRRLYLRGTLVTDVGLRHLRNLTSLEELSLHATRITDDGLINVEGLHRLKLLDLGFNHRITTRGLQSIRGLTELLHLNVYGTAIDNDAIDILLNLKQLVYLEIHMTQVTDAAVIRLTQLQNLQYLVLDRWIERDTLDAIKTELPDCTIEVR